MYNQMPNYGAPPPYGGIPPPHYQQPMVPQYGMQPMQPMQPQYGMAPQQQQPTVVVINQGGDNQKQDDPNDPQYCDTCKEETTDTVKFEAGSTAYCWCFCLMFVALCCVPFCSNDCKDIHYVCNKCQRDKRVEAKQCC